MPGLSGNTLRQVVYPTLGGRRVRLLLSNEWGNGPLRLTRAGLATSTAGGDIDPASDRALAFAGAPSVTIPAGETRFSDPLDYDLVRLQKLAITLHIASAPSDVTGHPGSRTTSYLAEGDVSTQPSLAGSATTDHWYFITGLDVEAADGAKAIVALGDSITGGRGSTTNGNDRWTDALARRLAANPRTTNVSVLNQGIGGNAVLAGGLGPTARDRFQRDVLEQRGVRWLIALVGLNDIGGCSDASIASGLVAAYEEFIAAAHTRGVLAYAVPLLPFAGSHYDDPVHQAARSAVNDWLRTSGRFDRVLELDRAVADPADPQRLFAPYDMGDHLHLSPMGYAALADAIELSWFEE